MTGLLDAGPWYAYLVGNDVNHAWTKAAFARYTEFLTCEAVVSEVVFLLRRAPADHRKPLRMLHTGAIRRGFNLDAERDRTLAIMERYERAAVADACLVRMSELFPRAEVLTTDEQDFSIYRRNGRGHIPYHGPGSRTHTWQCSMGCRAPVSARHHDESRLGERTPAHAHEVHARAQPCWHHHSTTTVASTSAASFAASTRPR